jgi:hypothetical protein
VTDASRGVVAAALVLVGAAGGVASLQPRLAHAAHAAGQREDAYALPPPAQFRAAALGWDAAAVDALWATLLVEYGRHWSEHHEFLDVPRYADTILELEPDYEPLYSHIDTMLVYRPLKGTASDARAAKAFLERGTRERPDDARLWLRYGQFLAFIGSSFVEDPVERAQWQQEGAHAIGRSVELGGDPSRALSTVRILAEAGQAQAAIEYLERAYRFTEHPSMAEVHEAIGERLAQLRALPLAPSPSDQGP